MFPVGNIPRTGVSTPIVKDGIIVDVLDPFKRELIGFYNGDDSVLTIQEMAILNLCCG